MAVRPRLSPRDLFLLTTPNDTEEASWMVMASLQVRDVDLIKAILLLHARRTGLPWVIESYLKITMPRPVGTRSLEAAPDLLVVVGQDRLRTSWNIVEEGKAPEFVLEVVTGSSWERDTEDKPLIYEGMGVREFALFAPERQDGGPRLFGYRQDEGGQLVPWGLDAHGVLWSEQLGLGLYVEETLWLRALDHNGQRLPSPSELAEAAEAEVARLREELRRLHENPA